MRLGSKLAVVISVQCALVLSVAHFLILPTYEKPDIKFLVNEQTPIAKNIIQQSIEKSQTQQDQTEILPHIDTITTGYVPLGVVYYAVLVSIATNVALIFIVIRILRKENELKNRYERFAMLGEIAAKITHELRNPLTVIHTSVSLLKEKYGHGAEKEFQIIDRATSRMRAQIDDVLNHVRNLRLEMKMSSLRQIIMDGLEDVTVPENIRIILPDNDKTAYCDPEKIRIIIVNIIQNAIQAINAQQGTVKIKLDEDSDSIICQIEDSGFGIKKENLKNIFRPLFTTKPGGTGLGLYSCKVIMDKHDGKISVSNDPTTFTFCLPKNPKRLVMHS